MKDFFSSLEEVQKKYSDCNLLIPTATDVQLNPYYKYHIEEVPVDLDETHGDIFKVGQAPSGEKRQDGSPVYVDQFSLCKPLLYKLAMAAGIQFNPDNTYGERIDRMTYRAKAQGAMRKADGTARTETDQKVICLEDEEAKYRIEFSDKAAKGIADQRQAKAAAEIFKGTWKPGKDKYGNSVDRNGHQIMVYVIDEADRDRYIERSVMVNMALLKKTWAEKAITGAKLRVIRALLGIKGTYTKAELSRKFVIPTVIFSPDYSDPLVRQTMLAQAMGSVNNMFGMPALPVKRVDFDADTVYEAEVPSDMDNEAFRSDEPDGADGMPEAAAAGRTEATEMPMAQAQQEQETARTRAQDFCCDKCGTVITEKARDYSSEKFGRPLCFKCQKAERGIR